MFYARRNDAIANYRAGLAAAQYINAHKSKGKPVSPLDFFKFSDAPIPIDSAELKMHPAAVQMMVFAAQVKGRESKRGKSNLNPKGRRAS